MVEFVQLTVNGIAIGCIYALVALGFVLIYKATETVNFAQGDLMMLGAFIAYSCIALWGLPYLVGILIAVAVLAAVGTGLDRIVLRPVVGQPTFAIVMLTIGIGTMFRAGASMTPGWGTETYSFATPYSGSTLRFGTVVIAAEHMTIILATIGLCAGLFAFFRFTKLGVAMQASSQNQLAAYYMGIPVKTMFSLIWGISAGVAAVAGILMAPISLVDINMGFIGLKAFPAAVLGGFGSIPGAIVGGLIIGVIEALAGFYLPAGFKDTAAYIVLLVVLFVRPHGLFGQMARKKV
ncbi:MAG: branched-chain amino acid ABC transporter permease [Alphaproteobacteria bacterium]|nr:branched-chain amino acid ABC transporter permease [Alphaproteobacteria bacterium]